MQLLLLIVVAAAIVRFSTLSSQSIWVDEGLTASYVSGSLQHLLVALPVTDSNPPLFYALEWVFVRIFGSGDAGLRTLSAMAGTLTVPVIYAIGARVASRRAGLIAATLCAFEPMLWWYSQEARVYALFTLLSALALLAFVVALGNRSTWAIALWTIFSALLLTTHYFAIFQLVPEAAWMLVSLRGRRREILLALAGLGVLGISLAVTIALEVRNPGLAKLPLGPRLEVIVPQLLASPSPPADAVWIAALVLVIVGVALGLLSPSWRQRYFARVLASLAACDLLLPILAALAGRDYIIARNLIGTLIPLLVLVGIGFGSSRAPRAGLALTGAAAVLGLACLTVISLDPGLQRTDVKAAVASLGPPTTQRVVLSPGGVFFAFTVPRYVEGASVWCLWTCGPESKAKVPVEEVDVVIPDADPGHLQPGLLPKVGMCLMGQACQLVGVSTQERIGPPAPGFSLFSRREVTPFTVWRWRASAPRLLNFSDLAASAPKAPDRSPIALYQPSHS